MSIEKLKRVMQRLQEEKPFWEELKQYSLRQIRLAIWDEIGTDNRTLKDTITKLIDLGWLKRINRYQFKIGVVTE